MAPHEHTGTGRRVGELARALDDPAWDLRKAMTPHLADLDQRLDATGRLRGQLAQLLDSGELDGAVTDDLLAVLEAMTMLDTTAHRRISYLVYDHVEAAYDYLVRVFGLGAGS